MTKTELVAKMAEDAKITKRAAAVALDSFLTGVKATVAAGERVQIVNFGTFESHKRAARTGRNPQDPKKVIKIPAKIVPVFRAGAAFKNDVAK